MTRQVAAIVVVLALVGGSAACAARPRQRPLPTTPIEQGSGTMTEVRQQLAGQWILLSLTVAAADGRRQTIDATGAMTADAFGGLRIEYRVSESGLESLAALGVSTPNPVISTAGNVVIDPQQKQITYVGDDFQRRVLSFDPELAARRANPFALEHARFYAFGDDGTLTLTTRYDNGQEAMVGRWRRGH